VRRVTPGVERLVAALADRYRLERELGQGGMATVYLAHDLKHDRKVALKVLRPELAAVIGLERFLREIHVMAGLRHPHILPLFDSGQADDQPYFVMPYVAGESLRDRLTRERQLPVEEALRIAREVADALEFAHTQRIVHRDIKPENILLDTGHAVVADFGIARAVSAAGGDRLTQTGLTLGTPRYMSPEQASGELEIDGRSDQYALACVLYEMLAGEPPFSAPTAQGVIAKQIAQEPPDVTAARRTVPVPVARAIGKALSKTPADRFVRTAEFAHALQVAPAMPAPRQWRVGKRAGVSVAAAIAVVLAAAAALRAGWPIGPSDSTVDQLSATSHRLTQVTFRDGMEQWPAWSPDGGQLVFSAEVGGYHQLFLKELGRGEERQLTSGPRDDIQPSWSPDGTTIAFVRSAADGDKLVLGDVLGWYHQGGDVWLLEIATGLERRIVSGAFSPSFSPDGGRLAFDATWAGPRRIWVADSAGRNPRQVTTESSEAVTHTAPKWSPDGSRLVFRSTQNTKSDVMVVHVETQRATWITDDNIVDLDPVWSRSDAQVLFSSYRGGALNIWRIGVDSDGHATGPPQQLTTGAGDDLQTAVSHDGRLAFTVRGTNADIWRLPVDPHTGRATGDAMPVVSTTRFESRGAWSPDGQQIAFNSDRLGEMNLWLRTLATGAERQLTSGVGGDYQPHWSPDGSHITFFSARSGSNDIWTIRVADGELRRLTRPPGINTNPFYSPDGRQIAYHSDKDGRLDLWVMDADGANQRRLTSIGVDGHYTMWTRDGQWVIFRHQLPEGQEIFRQSIQTAAAEPMTNVSSGWHMSFSPDQSLIMDVRAHTRLWVHPADGSAPYEIFAFADPSIGIDYPVWSPDGRWVLFDRVASRGGDIWLMSGGR